MAGEHSLLSSAMQLAGHCQCATTVVKRLTACLHHCSWQVATRYYLVSKY